MFDFAQGKTGNHTDALEKIAELEKKYGIVFPDILKKYYLWHDGEKITLTRMEIAGYECEVAKIVPIIAEKMSFELITDNDRRDGFIADTLYPIARDRGGNYYYWDAATGKVYLIYCDDCENPFEVADSMNDFFEKMSTVKM